MRLRPLRLIGLAAIVLTIAGCGTTPPTRFYTLSPEIPVPANTQQVQQKVIIGIGPIEVAPYLERNQIVTRTGPTRLEVKEFDRWAASIESNIEDVLAINLSRLLPDTRPIVRPWPDADAQYTILIKFLRFDSDAAGNVQIQASWGIQSQSTQSMALIRDADIFQPSVGTDYTAITENMSTALATLSTQIAAELEQTIRR